MSMNFPTDGFAQPPGCGGDEQCSSKPHLRSTDGFAQPPGCGGDEQCSSKPHLRPPRPLLAAAGRAIGDFGMIRAGDRVLLGLSGGKDSLSLLHILMHLRLKAPVRFELAACTVDPQSPEYDPSPLKGYLADLGVPYLYAS